MYYGNDYFLEALSDTTNVIAKIGKAILPPALALGAYIGIAIFWALATGDAPNPGSPVIGIPLGICVYGFFGFLIPKSIADIAHIFTNCRRFPVMVQYWTLVGMVMTYNWLADRIQFVNDLPGSVRLVGGIVILMFAWLASSEPALNTGPWRSRRERMGG